MCVSSSLSTPPRRHIIDVAAVQRGDGAVRFSPARAIFRKDGTGCFIIVTTLAVAELNGVAIAISSFRSD